MSHSKKTYQVAAIAHFAAVIVAAFAPDGAAARSVGLTVYNDNLALVRDARSYELARGANEIRVVDVPAQIDPTSVLLSGEGLQVVEQNFEYDLASAERILDRYLDKDVTVVLESGDAFSGMLVSYEPRALVLTGSTGTRVISRERVDRIDFPELPGGLTTRPTLVWTLDAASGGTSEATMSYLTGGMQWHAEYVALVNADDTALELSAWVSLENRSGAGFEDAKLQLVAGDIHRARQDVGRGPQFEGMAAMAKSMDVTEESFFEYHLYTYERPVTVKDRQTKQLTLFPTANVEDVVKSYRYSGGRDVRVVLEFDNAENAGLGLALPAGVVRVYKQDSRGGTQLVGEDRIDHTPRDETLEITLGNAFDIVAERKIVENRQLSRNLTEQDIAVEIRNRKDEDVVVRVEERTWGDWEIVTASHVWDRESAYELIFTVPAEARSTTTLTFTLRMRR